jgi:Protein of unknown function (DUF3769)
LGKGAVYAKVASRMPTPLLPPNPPALTQVLPNAAINSARASQLAASIVNPSPAKDGIPEQPTPLSLSQYKAQGISKQAALLTPASPALLEPPEDSAPITISFTSLNALQPAQVFASASISPRLNSKPLRSTTSAKQSARKTPSLFPLPPTVAQRVSQAPTVSPPNLAAPRPEQPAPPTPDAPPSVPETLGKSGVVELKADRQEYDRERQILTATGNVFMRFQGSTLDADRLQVNLVDRRAVAEGNVVLRQGPQLFQGERLEYNFVQKTGMVKTAKGEVFLKDAGNDTSRTLPTDVTASQVSGAPLSGRTIANQPLTNVTGAGGIAIGSGFGSAENLRGSQVYSPEAGGTVNRLRFEAEQISFTPLGWEATNIRLTNDPFSPPELEVKANYARFRKIGPFQDEVVTKRSRIVFDQSAAIPLPLQRTVLDRRKKDPGLAIVQVGYDSDERGGFYIERTFNVFSDSRVQWSITPQIFLQSAITSESVQENLGVSDSDKPNGIFDPDLYGLKTRVRATIDPKTQLRGSLALTSLNPDVIEDNLRASIRLRRDLGNPHVRPVCPPQPAPQPDQPETIPSEPCRVNPSLGNYALNLEYSYRDRLFNGSLGFQTVQQSIGAVLTSPIIPIGNTGINLSYQVGAQQITAETDRSKLLDAIRDDDRVSLGRLQASAALSRNFTLWVGKPLPATKEEGLRYNATPIVPYVGWYTGLKGTSGYYTSGDTQTSIEASIGVTGQVGHHARKFFDYTSFNLGFSQVILGSQSPFFFDRVADQSVLSAGISQQLYGPLRLGVQTSLNVSSGEEISTDYILEYSRRTHSVILRYNPVQQIGSINLLINDFNWLGGTDPFSGSEVRSVEGGVIRSND